MSAVLLVVVSLFGVESMKVANASEGDNVYGYAWSSNVGWIKMNNCSDEDINGSSDNGSCSGVPFGVKINSGSGDMSGYAWSDNIGWIKFGGNPISGGVGGSNANLNIPAGSNVGLITGWAKALVGATDTGFDGWISFSGTNYPTGINYLNGSGGLTYNKLTARIVGSAWGGEVLGWINFSDEVNNLYKVTYGVVSPTSFAYRMFIPSDKQNISLSPNAEGKYASITVPVTLALTVGTTQNVALSVAPSNGKVSASLSSSSCSPTCSSNLTINIEEGIPNGDYVLTITSKASNLPDQTQLIHVFISPATEGLLQISCAPQGNPPYYVNKPITWTATIVSGDRGSDKLWWNGTNITPDSVTTSDLSFVKTYSTTGIKTVNVAVKDPNGAVRSIATCTPNATVLVQPDTHEI